MTAKEYLIMQCSDTEFSVADPKVSTALCAFAERMNKQKEGYSISSLMHILEDVCKIGYEDAHKCEIYVSTIDSYLSYRCPECIDD